MDWPKIGNWVALRFHCHVLTFCISFLWFWACGSSLPSLWAAAFLTPAQHFHSLVWLPISECFLFHFRIFPKILGEPFWHFLPFLIVGIAHNCAIRISFSELLFPLACFPFLEVRNTYLNRLGFTDSPPLMTLVAEWSSVISCDCATLQQQLLRLPLLGKS